ncbi:MAG: CBS domain-containing protein [Candidatus Nanoarchaeia archaeon]
MANLKYLIFIALIFILIVLVSASEPPNLPVFIYGKVYVDGKLKAEVPVSASFMDKNGIQKKVTTYTSGEDIIGYYKFEQGQIEVNEGEKILIEAMGANVIVYALAGERVKAEDIFIYSQKKQFFSGLIKEASKMLGPLNFFWKGKADYNQRDNTLNSNPILSNYSVDNSSFSSQNIKQGDLGSQETNEYIQESKDLYNNLESNASFGNSSEINNSNRESNKNITGNYSSYGLDYNDKIGKDPGLFNESQDTAKLNESFFSRHYIIFLFGAGIFIFVFLIFFIMRRNSAKWYFGFIAGENLEISINKYEKILAKEFVNKSPARLNINDNILTALEQFDDSNIPLLLVYESNKLAGTIEKRDILVKIKDTSFSNLEKTKLKEILNKDYHSCSYNSKLSEVYSILLDSKMDGIVVKDKSEEDGIITYYDFLKLLDRVNFEIENPPIIREAMLSDVLICDEKDSLDYIKEKMIKKNKDYAVITKNDSSIGIISIKDIIFAIYKNLDFEKTSAKNIMSSRLRFLDPGTQIYDAFKIMLEREFNQIPVVDDKETIGIVTMRSIVKFYYDLLLEIKQSLKKEKFKKDVEEM